MPIYGYRCTHCGHEVEVLQSMSAPPLTECEVCGGRLEKKLYPVGVVFKGSGFYSTDYKNGGRDGKSEEKSGSASEGGSSEKKEEKAAAEKKGEGTSEKKSETKGDAGGGGSSSSSPGTKSTKAAQS